MQIPAPVRAPTWASRRRIFEQRLHDLHKCSDFNEIKKLHALIYKSYLHKDPFVAPKLLSAYSLCHELILALKVFNQVEEPNVHLCNNLIRAQVHNFQHPQAFAVFLEMLNDGIYPDNFTYSFLLKGCSGQSSLKIVRMIHAHVEKRGFSSDVYVPNNLIDAYSKCGSMGVQEAKRLYESMVNRDVVSGNSMISGYVRVGNLREAQELFDQMPQRDIVTWNALLDGYAKAGEMSIAFELFEKMPSRDVVSWTIMISGYRKAGDMDMAGMLFSKMPAKNLVAWTIIISGYAEKGLAKEAVALYSQMEEAGLKLDGQCIVSILAACADSGLLGLGKRVHRSIKTANFKCSISEHNAIIDMYAKCGCLNKALSVFHRMGSRDLVSWNVMIHGLAMHGQGRMALQLFSRMKREGFLPDKVTFVGVLCACSHAGLIDKGIHYFHAMEKGYGITPEIEHYGCMVDLLGRNGNLREAIRLVITMPCQPTVVIWGALLAACRMHKAVRLGDDALSYLVKVAPKDSGNLSLLSDIYATRRYWPMVANTITQKRNITIKKPSGVSSLCLDDEICEFSAMDKSHPESDTIYRITSGFIQHLNLVTYADVVSEGRFDSVINMQLKGQNFNNM